MPAVAHVVAEHAGGRPVGSRVRHALAQDRVVRPPALGVGADGDPGHAHDRLDVGLAHAVDDDVGGQPVVGEDVEGVVRRVAAELVRDGLRASARPTPAATRMREITIPAQPGSSETFSQPRDAVACIRSRIVARVAGSRIAGLGVGDRQGEDRGRQDRRQGRRGRRVRVLVGGDVEAVAPGRSIRSTSASAMPQTACAPALRCETWRRAGRPASRRRPGSWRSPRRCAPSTPADSLRMWVAYRRAAACRDGDQRGDLVGRGVEPGRVDQPARDADRAGVQRLLDVADHRRELVRRRRAAVRGPSAAPRTVPWPTRRATFGPSGCRVHLVQVVGERRPGRVEPEVREVGVEHRADGAAPSARTCSRSCPTAGS